MQQRHYLVTFILGLGLCLMSGCSSFFDTDNTPPPTPLRPLASTLSIHTQWHTNTGSGIGSDYLVLNPALTQNALYTANADGVVTATDRATGKRLWQVNVHQPLSTGVAANHDLLVVGSRHGDVVALNQADGHILWQAHASSELLATAAMQPGLIVTKSIDGKVAAFSEQGNPLWVYQQTEPALLLRRASSAQLSQHAVIVGFANGNLVKLNAQRGNLLWQQALAVPEGSFAIQRMIDIDADPLIDPPHIYAVTYQGRMAALSFDSGQILWSHALSSYTGMAAADHTLYITDAKSHVWASTMENGATLWRQTQLEARRITAPATMGPYLVVGDGEGYVHWLDRQDGHFVGRTRVSGSPILATPLVDGSHVYVITSDGRLTDLSLN